MSYATARSRRYILDCVECALVVKERHFLLELRRPTTRSVACLVFFPIVPSSPPFLTGAVIQLPVLHYKVIVASFMDAIPTAVPEEQCLVTFVPEPKLAHRQLDLF